MADIALKVNGGTFSGWKSARVTNSIETLAGKFELSVSDRWRSGSAPWAIFEGDECELTFLGVTVIDGYVDRRSLSYDAEAHELSIEGRDRAADLVDCSAVLSSWTLRNVPLIDLATKLAKPFNVSVALDSGVSAKVSLQTGKQAGAVKKATGKLGGFGLPNPPKKFKIDPGESAFEVLDRACRMSGILPISDGTGGILLTRPGATRADTALVEGQNILRGNAVFDSSGRYYKYQVRTQHQQSDAWYGASATSIRGEATDAEIQRTQRVLVIRPENGMTAEAAKQRAAWEAKVRAARGDTVTVTVQGWAQASGDLWPLNGLVQISSPHLGVDGEMLITERQMSVESDGGTTTQLTLRRPDAFLPEPIITGSGLAGWKEIKHGV